jgi:hypothetical protein
MTYEFAFPKPGSMSASEAANWYRSMVPLIPKIQIENVYGDSEDELRVAKFKSLWAMKAKLRLAAALALHDAEIVDEFLQGFPLPSANEFLGSAFTITQDERAQRTLDWAEIQLLEVTLPEQRKFPGTVGEAIGMEINTADGVYVMTEEGWQKKT